MTDIDLTAAIKAARSVPIVDWLAEPIRLTKDEAHDILTEALPHILAQVEATDERIVAWEAVAKHPALKSCYDEERPLLPAVLDRLSNLAEAEWSLTELAPARVKPSREELLRTIGDALADSWSDVEEYAEAPDAITDAVLALLPGETEQDVREQVAAEIEAIILPPVVMSDRLPWDDLNVGRHVMRQQAAGIARGGAR